MKVVALAVLLVSAYFLYHGLRGLYTMAIRPPPGRRVAPDGINEIIEPVDPIGALVTVSVSVLAAAGVRWGLSKLR